MEKKKEETKKTFKPKIGGNSNNNPKKPFSFYWIYAIVGIALLSLQLLNWSGGASVITEAEFEAMVMNNDVEEVIVVKNKGIAKVTLTKEALAKEEHARKIKNNSVF